MDKKNDISTLIFDFGGVIINLDLPQCIQNLKKLGINDIESYLSNFGQKDFFLKYEKGIIDTEQFRAEIRTLSNRYITDDEIDDAWCSFLCDIPQQKIDLLTSLRGKYKLLLLSNSNPLHAEVSATKALGNNKSIRDFFDKVYFSYEMGLAKPEKEIYYGLLSDAGVKAEECLFLDDGPRNIEVAKQIGIQTYHVKQGEPLDFLLNM